MTPIEMITRYAQKFPDERDALLNARILLHFIAENFCDAQFSTGQLIVHSDLIGLREWIGQLEAAAAERLGQVTV